MVEKGCKKLVPVLYRNEATKIGLERICIESIDSQSDSIRLKA